MSPLPSSSVHPIATLQWQNYDTFNVSLLDTLHIIMRPINSVIVRWQMVISLYIKVRSNGSTTSRRLNKSTTCFGSWACCRFSFLLVKQFTYGQQPLCTDLLDWTSTGTVLYVSAVLRKVQYLQATVATVIRSYRISECFSINLLLQASFGMGSQSIRFVRLHKFWQSYSYG
jgi:hypothetical protein